MMRGTGRKRLTAILMAIAALSIAGVAAAAPLLGIRLNLGLGGKPPVSLQLGIGGDLFLGSENTRAGRSVLVAEGLLPGDSRFGDVTIVPKGLLRGRFRLETTGLTDARGPGGGALSAKLRIRVQDVFRNARTVYDGTLADLRRVDLGVYTPNEPRRYRVTASFPPGDDDNAVMGSSSRVTFVWTGVECTLAQPLC